MRPAASTTTTTTRRHHLHHHHLTLLLSTTTAEGCFPPPCSGAAPTSPTHSARSRGSTRYHRRGCVVRPQTFDPVLEYILAQRLVGGDAKEDVAAFHPQARADPDPARHRPPRPPQQAHHHPPPPPPSQAQRLQRIAAKDPSKLGVRAGRLVVEREVTRAILAQLAQFCAIILRRSSSTGDARRPPRRLLSALRRGRSD